MMESECSFELSFSLSISMGWPLFSKNHVAEQAEDNSEHPQVRANGEKKNQRAQKSAGSIQNSPLLARPRRGFRKSCRCCGRSRRRGLRRRRRDLRARVRVPCRYESKIE